MTNKPDKTPGQELEETLLRLPPERRPAFLARVERKVRETNDLELARALKQYREMSRELRPKADREA